MAYEDYLRALQGPESGGNPNALNQASGAAGLYQIMPGVAEGLRRQGFNFDMSTPEGQTAAAQELTRQNDVLLRSRLGRDPTDAERYFAHGFGGPAAAYLLANPDRPLGQSLREFYSGTRQGERFADRVYEQNPNLRPLWDQPVSATVTDFGSRLAGGRRAARPTLTAARPGGETITASQSAVPRLSSEDVLRLVGSDPNVASDFGPLVNPAPGQQVAQAAVPIPPRPGPEAAIPPRPAPGETPIPPRPAEGAPLPAPADIPTLQPPAAQPGMMERFFRFMGPNNPQVQEGVRRLEQRPRTAPSESTGSAVARGLESVSPVDATMRALQGLYDYATGGGGGTPGGVQPTVTVPQPALPPPPSPQPYVAGPQVPGGGMPVPPTPTPITPLPQMDYSRVLDALQRMTPAAPTPRTDREIAIDMLLGGLRGAGGYQRGDTIGSVLGRFGAGAGEAGTAGRQYERQQQDAYRNAVAEAAGRQAQTALGITGQQQQANIAGQQAQQHQQQMQYQQFNAQMALYNAMLNQQRMLATTQARGEQPLGRPAQEALIGRLRAVHMPAAIAQAQGIRGFQALPPAAQGRIIDDIAMHMLLNTPEGQQAWRSMYGQLRAPHGTEQQTTTATE